MCGERQVSRENCQPAILHFPSALHAPVLPRKAQCAFIPTHHMALAKQGLGYRISTGSPIAKRELPFHPKLPVLHLEK